MGRTGRRLVPGAVLMAVVLAAGCTTGPESTTVTQPDPTLGELPAGESGAFALADVPDGFEIDKAYDRASDRPEDDRRSISYVTTDDDEGPGWTITARPWPDDQPPFDELYERAIDEDPSASIGQVEVRGHAGYLTDDVSDGQVIGTAVAWEERPGLVVDVRVSDQAGVDALDLAQQTYEISSDVFRALVVGTTGGGEPGARLEAVTGTVDGDPYVLTAVLPEGYPLEPIDRRAGCLELEYRGETASSCDERMPFPPLDDADQAVLGGVSFGYGVFRDGLGEVSVSPVESPDGPWVPATTAVLDQAPDLTWWVLPFDRVCDRTAISKSARIQPVGVPPGYPRSSCD